jgi:putative hydrolase of the HAD superfamily
MDVVKAVAFDFGKVICLPPGPEVMEKLAGMAGLPQAEFEPLVWKLRDAYDRGTINGGEYFRRVLAAAGVRAEDATVEAMYRVDLESWTVMNRETITLMEDIKASGTTLGILSNMPHDFLLMARERFPVFSLPQVGIFSCETGSIKPEPAIYEALIAALHCVPGEIVFFDDMRVNVEGAAALGIRAFVWEDPGTARNLLRQLGLGI